MSIGVYGSYFLKFLKNSVKPRQFFFVLYTLGFNPAETKIRTPGGKVWHEDEFHSISRELYQDIALQLTGKKQS